MSKHAKTGSRHITSAGGVLAAGAAVAASVSFPGAANAATVTPGAPAAPEHEAAPASAGRPAQAGQTYTVQPGDTLSAIAGRLCGNPADYPGLAAASGISDPNFITPGEVIQVACQAALHAAVSSAAPVHKAAAVAADTVRVTGMSGTLGCSGLEALWEAAGGAESEAFTAAEIAMAESGGNQYALSPTDDYGYFQINGSHGPAQATFNAMGNAEAAVAISSDGTDWAPWTTYETGAYVGRC